MDESDQPIKEIVEQFVESQYVKLKNENRELKNRIEELNKEILRLQNVRAKKLKEEWEYPGTVEKCRNHYEFMMSVINSLKEEIDELKESLDRAKRRFFDIETRSEGEVEEIAREGYDEIG